MIRRYSQDPRTASQRLADERVYKVAEARLETFYARVMTEFGNEVHLVEVGNRHRPIEVRGRLTLCGYKAYTSMDGCGDEMSCGACARFEAKTPKRRRAPLK